MKKKGSKKNKKYENYDVLDSEGQTKRKYNTDEDILRESELLQDEVGFISTLVNMANKMSGYTQGKKGARRYYKSDIIKYIVIFILGIIILISGGIGVYNYMSSSARDIENNSYLVYLYDDDHMTSEKIYDILDTNGDAWLELSEIEGGLTFEEYKDIFANYNSFETFVQEDQVGYDFIVQNITSIDSLDLNQNTVDSWQEIDYENKNNIFTVNKDSLTEDEEEVIQYLSTDGQDLNEIPNGVYWVNVEEDTTDIELIEDVTGVRVSDINNYQQSFNLLDYDDFLLALEEGQVTNEVVFFVQSDDILSPELGSLSMLTNLSATDYSMPIKIVEVDSDELIEEHEDLEMAFTLYPLIAISFDSNGDIEVINDDDFMVQGQQIYGIESAVENLEDCDTIHSDYVPNFEELVEFYNVRDDVNTDLIYVSEISSPAYDYCYEMGYEKENQIVDITEDEDDVEESEDEDDVEESEDGNDVEIEEYEDDKVEINTEDAEVNDEDTGGNSEG